MAENFMKLWRGGVGGGRDAVDDNNTEVIEHEEEIVCGIDNNSIMEAETTEVETEADTYEEVCEEVVVHETIIPDENQMSDEVVEEEDLTEEQQVIEELTAETIIGGYEDDDDDEDDDDMDAAVVYVTEDHNVVVVPTTAQNLVTFQDNYMDCQVTEEVITDDWVNNEGEERVEVPVGEVGAEQQIEYDDLDVPLPTDQDEYTASRPYPCDFCSRRFRKKANLMNHMVAHQTDRPHGCNLCGARYIRKCDLMNHLKIHAYVPDPDGLEEELVEDEEEEADDTEDESKKTRKKLTVTKKRNKKKIKQEPTSEIEERYNYVEEDVRLLTEMVEPQEVRYPIIDARKPFVCQHCGVAFAREKALASHSRVHQGDSPFECETCNEMFWDVQLLKDHVRTKHAGVGIDTDDDDYVDEDYVDGKFGEFYCKVCGMRFHRIDLLRRHSRTHPNMKEEFVEPETEDYGHVCNVCGQSFNEALDLLAHAESHARQLDHRCMLCGECFQDENAMSQHVMQRHGKTMPPNTCMLCGKTCKDRRTLLKHSWDHSKEKLFSCSKCGKSFHNKARLKRHMVSHRNKVVQCDVCGDDFPDGRSLMNHRHSHSNISGRQFPCRECGKTFGSRSSQQIHIRIHTGERPYGCRFCWKAFADGGTLRKHERIHTGEKPYACAVCPRAFNQRVVLREHIRSHHSGPDPQYSHTMTPYCCSVCNDMFSTSQDLIIHLIHHCDLNTALKRQPQVGPRKYKRRRKLKPHELDIISSNKDEMDFFSDTEERKPQRARKQSVPKPPQLPPPPPPVCPEIDNASIQQGDVTIITKPSRSGRKKLKQDANATPATPRPKMIHTQKTKVVDTGDGKGKLKTKTLITRTTPVASAAELSKEAKDRIRPRTKNVNYHSNQTEKLPIATFENNEQVIKTEPDMVFDVPEVANEETVIDEPSSMPPPPPPPPPEQPVPTAVIHVTKARRNNSLTPGRHIIGPGNKVIRIVKGGMLVKKEPEVLLPDVKQEMVEASSLHELAELSMQHAQNHFRCEMCSATFNDRSQLLMHVPIHI